MMRGGGTIERRVGEGWVIGWKCGGDPREKDGISLRERSAAPC